MRHRIVVPHLLSGYSSVALQLLGTPDDARLLGGRTLDGFDQQLYSYVVPGHCGMGHVHRRRRTFG
jgi:hypothetical protein